MHGDLDTKRYTELSPNNVWATIRSGFFAKYAAEFPEDLNVKTGILDCTDHAIEDKVWHHALKEHLKDWGALSERDKAIINCEFYLTL